ncbi:hypothetical protein HYC85_026235 [Camellia sinensis]|uniref:Uncharacterized protein n=1 Tax=Camellia sinensis TaxID=4442 RepID=A0A7J7G724_CAMSI|nr:hypothetical protein HYC85_026235 [Camellia sinensis]
MFLRECLPKAFCLTESMEKENTGLECSKCSGDGPNGMSHGEKASKQFTDLGSELTEDEREELELELIMLWIDAISVCMRTGLIKLRRVLRAIRKHIPQPPDNVLAGNAIDKFLDDPNLCEDKLSEVAGSDGFLDSIMKIIFPDGRSLKQLKASSLGSSDPYLEVYCNLYYLLAQAGFVLTKEGEEFVERDANLFKYDLQYNPLRFESWQRLANIYDEVVAEYSFSESTKENVMKILSRMGTEIPDLLMDVEDKSIQTNPEDTKLVDSHQLEEAWHMLYRDCLSALEICVEGDLKHFHKARYMLAQGLYRRGDTSCAVLPSSVNLYVVPFQLATAGHFYPGLDGVNALDLNIPRKLLLWA